MSDLGDQLRSRAQARPHGATTWGFASSALSVRTSLELERIVRLPRRPPYVEDPARYTTLVSEWTQRLRKPGSTAALWPIQAFSLNEAADVGGLYLAAGVGRGKTLTSLLLPLVLKSKRAILFVPTGAYEQLTKINYPALARDWHLPTLWSPDMGGPGTTGVDSVVRVVTYHEWSDKKGIGRQVLDEFQPDLIVADEAHALIRKQTARYRRLRDYVRSHPQTRFCFMTGSPVHDSIRDFAHLLALALRAGSPVPRSYYPLEEWAQALDPVRDPIAPGALSALCRDGESAREGFARRLVETPGFVSTTVSILPVRLVLHVRKPEVPPAVQRALDTYRSTWMLPNGGAVDEILDYYRHARELSAGFYYRWAPAPSEEWLDARAAWHREVRDFLKHGGRPGLDSPGLLEDAARSGSRPSANFEAWSAIKGTCRPKTVPMWLSDFLVRDALEWAATHGREGGLIWFEYDALETAIRAAAATTGVDIPVYGAGDDGVLYEKGDRPVFVSMSHYQSKELQAFHRQYVLVPPASGRIWEQLLGRMYRAGQKSPVIETWVALHTPEYRKAFDDALVDARFFDQSLGMDQKLLRMECVT